MAPLAKLPKTRPAGGTKPILPGFDGHIGDLRSDRLAVAPAVTGIARSGRVEARADIASGRARVALAAVIEGSDRVRMTLDAEPNRDRFDLDVQAKGSKDGVLARLSGIRHPLALTVAGDEIGRAAWRERVCQYV